jgi:predicted DNA-binding transcriptional regulator AlpA
METNLVTEAPRLLDMHALGDYLGLPWRSLERQLKNPPLGFPLPVRLGRRIFWSRDQVDAWLRGVSGTDLPLGSQTARGPGRPRKQPREDAAGQGG